MHAINKYNDTRMYELIRHNVTSPKVETYLTNPLLISTKTRLPTLNKLCHNERTWPRDALKQRYTDLWLLRTNVLHVISSKADTYLDQFSANQHVTEKKRTHVYCGSYAGCKRVFYFTLPRANINTNEPWQIDSNTYASKWRAYGDVYAHEQVHVTLLLNQVATILLRRYAFNPRATAWYLWGPNETELQRYASAHEMRLRI